MADGDDRRYKRGHMRPKARLRTSLVDVTEVFMLTSGSQDCSAEEDMSEEVCLALENAGCCVRLVSTSGGLISKIRSALWVVRRSAASKLIMVDTHPIVLLVLRCMAAPRLTYIQRTSQLNRLPVPKCIHQILLRLADDVIVQNKASADLYQTMFCNCKAPKILYPCIDIGSMETDEPMPIQKVLPNLSKYTNLFLTYGEFQPVTNFDLVIDAFEIFYNKVHGKNRGDKIRLIIAGNLDIKSHLQKSYHSYLRERLCGKKFSKDVFIITKLSTRCKKTLLAYSVCAIFANISIRQLLEALFVGRPTIATKTSITKEMLPKRAGFRLSPSPKEFAKILLFLHGDAQLAEKMGHNAKAYYAQYYSYIHFARKVRNFVEGNYHQCKTCLEFYGSKRVSSTDMDSCSLCTRYE